MLPVAALAQAPPGDRGTNITSGGSPASQQQGSRPKLTFFQIIFSGGPLGIANMVVLIGLSITALALAADDLRIVRKANIIPDSLADQVRELVAAGEICQAPSAFKRRPSLFGAVLLHSL